MLNFGNKEFRNLQEQVLKNMADIKDIHEGTTVLGEFGIKVVGQVESSSDLPDPTEYDGEYGDAYVVGEEAPYDYYIFTRPFEDVDDPQWFNLGQFPAPGPQGETGETGATGATPAIVATATTSTLSAGQDASVTITKTGTDEEPHFTFAFEIPQGVQGVQGVQGAQGIQGPAGPQGIQGQKGDTGYLYTIIGQVNDESSLPLPGQVGRTSAFLVGTQEPYDVYIIIGQDAYDLEWLNIGPIATVVPTTYIASDTDASSGTLDATTLAAITNETGVHYMRVGSELYEYANTYNGNAYYMSLRYDSSISRNKIARFIVALSSGAWTTGSDAIPDAEHTVFTNTDQTITGSKTFSSVIKAGFSDVSLVGLNGIAGFRAYKPGTTTQAGQMIVTNDGTVAGSYRAVIQAYNGTQDAYNTLRIGDTEGFKYYVNNNNIFTIGTNGLDGSTMIFGADDDSTNNYKKGLEIYSSYDGYINDDSSHLILHNSEMFGGSKVLLGTTDSYITYNNYISSDDESTLMYIGDPEKDGSWGVHSTNGLVINPDFNGDDYYLKLYSIPSNDPSENHAIWNNAGVLMKSGSTGMPVFNPGIKVGANLVASIPFYSYQDGAATASTITRDATIDVAGGAYEFDISVTFKQHGIVIGSEDNLPYSSICAGYNFVKFPNAISLSTQAKTEDEVFDYLLTEYGDVTLCLVDSNEGMSYLMNDPNTTVWVIPTLAVRLKRGNAYEYIIQTPADVDGRTATYDLTNITIPSGYTLPDSGSRGLRIGIGGTAGGQINWIGRYSGIACPTDY